MPIKYQKWIYRRDLKANPEWRYVFGDNVMREGFGGQAKEMRGEHNAIGVATKFSPTMEQDAFFYDGNMNCWNAVKRDLAKVEHALSEGRTVVFPEDGIGTGLSRLPERAPRLNIYIQERIADMAARFPEPQENSSQS